MRQCLTVAVAASMLLALAGVAQADNGMPSQSTLRAMGLSGIQVMSDREASEIRGMGYYSSRKHSKSVAIAFGISYASVGGKHGGKAGSVDGFLAVGHHAAGGVHGSIAGKVDIYYRGGGRDRNTFSGGTSSGPPNHGGGGHGGGGVKVKATVVFAGGFAKSYAY